VNPSTANLAFMMGCFNSSLLPLLLNPQAKRALSDGVFMLVNILLLGPLVLVNRKHESIVRIVGGRRFAQSLHLF
jgi:hypothetical protein